MTWRHLSNLPAAVFSFRYVIKGPSKSPLKTYFSFCACDFRGDHIRWKISANAALTCEKGRESVGNCGSFRAKTQFYADFPGQFDCGEITLLRSS